MDDGTPLDAWALAGSGLGRLRSQNGLQLRPVPGLSWRDAR